MCSQPIVQAAHETRAIRRAGARSATLSRSAPSNRLAWKFRVGRASNRLKVNRLATVPSSRYFSVAGPNDKRE